MGILLYTKGRCLEKWDEPVIKYDKPLYYMNPHTIPETNIAPENGWLEYDCFLLGWPIFSGELFVLGSAYDQPDQAAQ